MFSQRFAHHAATLNAASRTTADTGVAALNATSTCAIGVPVSGRGEECNPGDDTAQRALAPPRRGCAPRRPAAHAHRRDLAAGTDDRGVRRDHAHQTRLAVAA